MTTRNNRKPPRGGGIGNAALGWLKGQFKKKPLPIWILTIADVLLLGISLVVFALFHHVIPRPEQSTGRVSQRTSTVQAQTQAVEATPQAVEATPLPETVQPQDEGQSIEALQTEAAQPTPETTPEPVQDPVGYFGTKFADKFTNGEVIKSDTGYQSGNVNITLTTYDEQGVRFYVADVYVKDISLLKTAFAQDKFGRYISEWPADLNKRLGGIIAVNGDYYGARSDGIVIRNGELYREDGYPSRDVCVLFWDGTMETYSPAEFDLDEVMERGAYQSWNFGPKLLDSYGMTMTSFNSDVNPRNPRTAIGYFEPGHYCLIVVDGRSSSSKGVTLKEFSQLVYNLGCQRAFNMDGGQTSEMVVGGTVVNNPYKGGRQCSDIIMIVDQP